jgi:hypothetical protein
MHTSVFKLKFIFFSSTKLDLNLIKIFSNSNFREIMYISGAGTARKLLLTLRDSTEWRSRRQITVVTISRCNDAEYRWARVRSNK